MIITGVISGQKEGWDLSSIRWFITDQCFDGFSLYLALSSSGTGFDCCRSSEAVILSRWSSGGGTWSQAFLLQTSASLVKNLICFVCVFFVVR